MLAKLFHANKHMEGRRDGRADLTKLSEKALLSGDLHRPFTLHCSSFMNTHQNLKKKKSIIMTIHNVYLRNRTLKITTLNILLPFRITIQQRASEHTQRYWPYYRSTCQSYVFCGRLRRFFPSRPTAQDNKFPLLMFKTKFWNNWN